MLALLVWKVSNFFLLVLQFSPILYEIGKYDFKLISKLTLGKIRNFDLLYPEDRTHRVHDMTTIGSWHIHWFLRYSKSSIRSIQLDTEKHKRKITFQKSQKYLKSTDIFVHRINFDLKKKVEKFFNTKARVMVKFLEVEKWEIFHFLGVTNWNNLRTQNSRQFKCKNVKLCRIMWKCVTQQKLKNI